MKVLKISDSPLSPMRINSKMNRQDRNGDHDYTKINRYRYNP